jgi:hypothetical protein
MISVKQSKPSSAPSAIKDTTLKLFSYCKARNWAGADPYDALNSKIFQAIPLLDRRIPRLILSQALKRSVFDLRPMLLVPPTQNPKALGLFLTSSLKLSKLGLILDEDSATKLIGSIKALRSLDKAQYCWGYSFPWQTRTLLVPRYSPNLVCTVFVANALLDAYEQLGDAECLEMAASGGRYILDELYWEGQENVAGFAYPLPSMRNNVHNGNLLGAALLCRIASLTGEGAFLDPVLKVTRYSASRQRPDGSWMYGESPNQQWIDNFHSGYNLCALREIGKYLQTNEFDRHQQLGFEFYLKNFFRHDGAAKYFHDRTYPVDIHSVAQSIITLLTFQDLEPGSAELASKVYNWAMDHMWDKRGFFYYRVLQVGTIRTSYMRWSQAWMLLALTDLLSAASLESNVDNRESQIAFAAAPHMKV